MTPCSSEWAPPKGTAHPQATMSAGPRGAENTHGRGEAMRGGGCSSYAYTYSYSSEGLPSQEEQRQGRGEKWERPIQEGRSSEEGGGTAIRGGGEFIAR